ncbi:MAG: hypothetical protein KDF24_10185 [Rhodocyclaceae bacterium]|nr:hypothetical protein [Rhodocyclaceae bacterium]
MFPPVLSTPPILAVQRFVREVWGVYWRLLKLMVPALIVVKGLETLGATAALARLLSPLMQLVGLPDAMGIVWAASLLVNLYTGLVVFFDVLASTPLTVAQVTVLGTLMLVAHALPMEAAVARAAGVSVRATVLIRVGGALLLGMLLHASHQAFGLLEQPLAVAWQPAPGASTLAGWAIEQVRTLGWVLLIIAALMAVMALLRWLHVERLLHWALGPVLRLIGIRHEAANITIVGVMLGITLGAGLLLKDVRAGRLTRRDVFLTMGFLGLFHSAIEDTLLIALMGADLSGILWARLVFALVVIALLARVPALDRRLAAPLT